MNWLVEMHQQLLHKCATLFSLEKYWIIFMRRILLWIAFNFDLFAVCIFNATTGTDFIGLTLFPINCSIANLFFGLGYLVGRCPFRAMFCHRLSAFFASCIIIFHYILPGDCGSDASTFITQVFSAIMILMGTIYITLLICIINWHQNRETFNRMLRYTEPSRIETIISKIPLIRSGMYCLPAETIQRDVAGCDCFDYSDDIIQQRKAFLERGLRELWDRCTCALMIALSKSLALHFVACTVCRWLYCIFYDLSL